MEVARPFLLLPGNEGRTPVAYGRIEREKRGGECERRKRERRKRERGECERENVRGGA